MFPACYSTPVKPFYRFHIALAAGGVIKGHFCFTLLGGKMIVAFDGSHGKKKAFAIKLANLTSVVTPASVVIIFSENDIRIYHSDTSDHFQHLCFS